VVDGTTVAGLVLGNKIGAVKATIQLPRRWINSACLDDSLAFQTAIHGAGVLDVELVFPSGCKVMVDAGTRLLSLVNQAAHAAKRVRLVFEEGAGGTMGYLQRMGFFEFLDSSVRVQPEPTAQYLGEHRQHRALIEFARIHPSRKDENLPTQLADRIGRGATAMTADRARKLEDTAWHVFAELIQNIHRHAEAPIDGFAALQIYKAPRGRRAVVSVSDSGLGLLRTLRHGLEGRQARTATLSDAALLLKVVSEGVSRFGSGNGCGICTSAQKALAFDTTLDFRLYNSSLHLEPKHGSGFTLAHHRENLTPMWGTHIAFEFKLDN